MAQRKTENVETVQPDAVDSITEIKQSSVKIARSTIAIIDTVVQRGAIKGEELSTVGNLRDQAVQLIQKIEGPQG